MFRSVTFNFSHPFCDCDELDYGYGLSSMNGVPAFTFQCHKCATTIMMPLPKLHGGFNFDFLPPGVTVAGQTKKELTSESQTVERDNVIYGPWAGSDRPED